MPRTFNGTSDLITTSGSVTDPLFGTFAGIVKASADGGANRTILQSNTAAGIQFGLKVHSGNELRLGVDAGNKNAPTITVLSSEGWVLVAITKATGSVLPRFHKYVFSTGIWTHESGASNQADSIRTPNTGYFIGHGGSANYWAGDILVTGFFNDVLSDSQVESLAYNLISWYNNGTDAGFLLDQDDVSQNVCDFAGDGAKQTSITGTTVSSSSVPVFSYGSDPIRASLRTGSLLEGILSLSGSSVLTLEGTPVKLGILSLSGESDLSLNGIRIALGSVSFSGLSSLLVAGDTAVLGAVLFSGNSVLDVNGQTVILGAISLSGDSILEIPIVGLNSVGEVIIVGNSELLIDSFAWRFLIRDEFIQNTTLKVIRN